MGTSGGKLRGRLAISVAIALIFGVVAVAVVPAGAASSWSIVPSPSPLRPDPLQLSAVSCADAMTCFAVGYRNKDHILDYHTGIVIEQWDGSTWSTVVGPVAGRQPQRGVVSDRDPVFRSRRPSNGHLDRAVGRHELEQGRRPESRWHAERAERRVVLEPEPVHRGGRLGVGEQDEDARRALGRRRLAHRCEPQSSRRDPSFARRRFLPERDQLLRGGRARRRGRLHGRHALLQRRRAPRALERHGLEDPAVAHAEVACTVERRAARHAVARRHLVPDPHELQRGRLHTVGRARRALERHQVAVGGQPTSRSAGAQT